MAWKRGKKKTTPDAAAPKVPKPKKEFEVHTIAPEELMNEGTVLVSVTLPGRPATKKTHQNVVMIAGRPRVLPSKQYVAFEKSVKDACEDAWKNLHHEPMDFGVGVQMRVWLDTWVVGDHTGYMQAIGDIIQKWEIIADDAWISWISPEEHWFGGVDKDNPRTELVITRVVHPKEAYRREKEALFVKAQERKKTKEDAKNAKGS